MLRVLRAAATFGASAVMVVAHQEEPWMKLWCLQERIGKGDECPNIAAKKDEQCTVWYNKYRAVEGVKKKVMNADDTGCQKFFRDKQDCSEKAAGRGLPSKNLKKAAAVCEKAVLQVCTSSVCPTYKKLLSLESGDCHAWCQESGKQMFHTGEHADKCFDGGDWADCLRQWRNEQSTKNRRWQMEALMREHLVKCVCVSARDDDSICYNGKDGVGLGIPYGQRWCDFYNTPSWRNLLLDRYTKGEFTLWAVEPQCERKPLTSSTSTEALGAGGITVIACLLVVVILVVVIGGGFYATKMRRARADRRSDTRGPADTQLARMPDWPLQPDGAVGPPCSPDTRS